MIKLAVDNIQNWIFVTGVPRSGTTFLGMILSLPKEVDYIHEPFNPQCGLKGLNQLVNVNQGYFYMRSSCDTELMQDYNKLTKKIFTYDFHLENYIPKNDSLQRKLFKTIIGSRGPFYLRLAKINLFHKNAIIKDPIGALLCEYLYLNFGVKPVIVVKHPASFIASLKRVGFWPNLSKIKNKKSLIEDYFSDDPTIFDREYSSEILAASAFWKVIYKVLLTQARKYPDWQVIVHEELSQNPVVEFKKLYDNLGLQWSESVENKIEKQTNNASNKQTDVKKGVVQDFKRKSSDIFEMRLNSLSLEERRDIFDIVKDVALDIYSVESFGL